MYDTFNWSFRGGLIWVMADPLTVSEPAPPALPITLPAEQGATQIRVPAEHAAAARAWQHQTVHLRWLGDQDFLRLVYGHDATFDQVPWKDWPLIGKNGVRYISPNRITAVEAADQDTCTLHLAEPLRLPVRPAWKPVLARRTGELEGVSIESLTIRMPEHYTLDAKGRMNYTHLREPGWNGIFLEKVSNCRIRDVVIENADVAIGLEESSHCTVERVTLKGGKVHRMHHGVTLRYCANENLIQDVTVEGEIQHGISMQDLASGNVIRRCTFHHGTIECHRGLPFDCVRSDITFHRCDGGGGGAIGPYAGRGHVMWNLRFLPPPADVTDPKTRERWHRSGMGLLLDRALYPGGLMAGIQGAESFLSEKPWAMPPGEKGCRVLDQGKVPNPPDCTMR